MSFLYPRVIQISRPGVQSGVGQASYGGADVLPETCVAKDVQASIQYEKTGSRPNAGIPGDIDKRSLWKILFKLPNGVVASRDIITDDLGQRYQVAAPYWNSLGYAVVAERLES